MNSSEIRKRFISFFQSKGHTAIPSASVIPENDASVLFTTAGMQPLVPYLLGEKHPGGNRLTNSQKCIRTGDIDEVGDNTHLTFFEMLGNWSLGDYFKKDSIAWSWEFLTSTETGLGIDPNRIYVTVFEGNEDAPRDEESYKIWAQLFTEKGLKPEERIFFMPAKNNWWSAGDNGPCGPDTEIFYDVSGKYSNGLSKEEYLRADEAQEVVEIWNNVFMEYLKEDGVVTGKLSQQNVDTGMGLERITAVLSRASNVYRTDIFSGILNTISNACGIPYDDEMFAMNGSEMIAMDRSMPNDMSYKSMRIIADHLRCSVIMANDGVEPSNKDQGYIMRRLIRRAVRHAKRLNIDMAIANAEIVESIVTSLEEGYPELRENQERIQATLDAEIAKFLRTLEKGLRELQKIREKQGEIRAEDAFNMYQSHGFPLELTEEIASEYGQHVDRGYFVEAYKKHQEVSKQGSEKKFAGGLADHSNETVKLHTATHLLHMALRKVLGEHVEQKGSNITAERLRFDFSHPEKMTDEQKREVERIVNEQIQKALPVDFELMTVEEAKASGAIGLFEDKYAQIGGKIKVYRVGNDAVGVYSREICGGPHVANTAELGTFVLQKEEASSSGVRRIKAILQS